MNMDGSNICSGSHMKHSGLISAGEEEERLGGGKIVYGNMMSDENPC